MYFQPLWPLDPVFVLHTAGNIYVSKRCDYFAHRFYVVTPITLQLHLDSSLNRLCLQLWPSFLLLAGLLCKREVAAVFILNDSVPELWQYHGAGSLFKMLYNDDTITTAYRSLGHSPQTRDSERLVVMQMEGEHLVDVTAAFQEAPQKFLTAVDDSTLDYDTIPGVALRVDPPEVIAGKDFYWITIAGFGGQDVLIQYTIDRGPVADFPVRLNPAGVVRFFVSTLTVPGRYDFLRFKRLSGQPSKWIKSEATIRVINPSRR